MKNQKPWTFNAKAENELEILLYDQIGQDWWTGEGTTAKAFAQDLKDAGNVSKIHLRVNSPGGNVFDGIAIYNTLLTHGAKVTAQVDGLAASIASVIIMAASEIAVSENGMVMIHNPSTFISGDSNDMRKMADTMDKVKANMITAYKRHCDLSTEDIGALMDEETWMTGQEAVDQGFADSVLDPDESGDNNEDIAANFDLSHFRKVPVQIAAMFGRPRRTNPRAAAKCICGCASCIGNDCKACVKDDCADEVCAGSGCPAQKNAKAASQRQLVEAQQRADSLQRALTDRDKRLQEQHAQIERQLKEIQALKDATKEDSGGQSRWLTRIGRDIEVATATHTKAISEITARFDAMQATYSKLTARIGSAESLLAKLNAERAGETTALATWSARISAQIRQGCSLFEWAVNQVKASDVGRVGMTKELSVSAKIIAELKTDRMAEERTLAESTRRICAKLVGVVSSEIIGQIERHGQFHIEPGERIKALETILGDLNTRYAAETTAASTWATNVTAKLEESRTLLEQAADEISRRAQLTQAACEVAATLDSASTLFTAFKSELAVPALDDARADLTRASLIYAAISAEISRRARLSAL